MTSSSGCTGLAFVWVGCFWFWLLALRARLGFVLKLLVVKAVCICVLRLGWQA